MDSVNKIQEPEDLTLRPGETEEFLHLYRDEVSYNPNSHASLKDPYQGVSSNELEEITLPQIVEVIPTYEELIQIKHQQMRRIGKMENRPRKQLSQIDEIFHNKFRRIEIITYEEAEDYGDKLLESYMKKYTYEELEWYVKQISKIVEHKSIDHTLLSVVIIDTIKCCYVHPVTFKMVFEDLSIHQVFEFTKDEEFFETLTWDSLAFGPKDMVLEIFNKKTGNNDRRGGGCGHKNIQIEEFRYTIKNDQGITIRDLTEAVYRMKGSKYDNYYEMLIKIKVREQDQDKVVVEAIFDYGS
jgi:hypothetical protein